MKKNDPSQTLPTEPLKEKTFHEILGLPPKAIRSAVILVPFAPRVITAHLSTAQRFRGRVFQGWQTDSLTVLLTKVGAGFSGDAVLALAGTGVKAIFWVGTCGSLHPEKFPCGQTAHVRQAVALESFSQIVSGCCPSSPGTPASPGLIQAWESVPQRKTRSRPAVCASVGSVLCEPLLLPWAVERGIDLFDQETAAVYHAAAHIQKPALSLLTITDIVQKDSAYDTPASALTSSMKQSLEQTFLDVQTLIKALD